MSTESTQPVFPSVSKTKLESLQINPETIPNGMKRRFRTLDRNIQTLFDADKAAVEAPDDAELAETAQSQRQFVTEYDQQLADDLVAWHAAQNSNPPAPEGNSNPPAPEGNGNPPAQKKDEEDGGSTGVIVGVALAILTLGGIFLFNRNRG